MKKMLVTSLMMVFSTQLFAAPNTQVLQRKLELEKKNPGHVQIASQPDLSELGPEIANTCTMIVQPFKGFWVYGIYLLPSKGTPAYDSVMYDTSPPWKVTFRWAKSKKVKSLAVRIQTDGAISTDDQTALNGNNQLAATCQAPIETHTCTPTTDGITLSYSCN